MFQETLILPSDVRSDNHYSTMNLSDNIIISYIEDAQKMEVIPILGMDLFLKLQEGDEREAYQNIINGCNYTSKCGVTKKMSGLKSALINFTVSRIIRNTGFVITRSGFVEKNLDYSSHAIQNEKIAQSNYMLNMAQKDMSDIVDYLNDKEDEIEEWSKTYRKKIKSKTVIKIIGK